MISVTFPVAVEDPNFPSNAAFEPRSSTLSADVFRRVAKLKAEAAEAAKANPQAARNSMLWSEFSAPSPIVSLPSLNDSYAGPVDPGAVKVYDVGPAKIEFNSKPPKGKVVVAQWNPKYGAALPVYAEVMRGAVINKKGVIDVPDPVTFEIRKIPDEVVNTSNVVLDLTGGKPLLISEAENQTEPGAVLMFDPAGGLEVVDEIDTQRSFRLYSFADEREE
jgi:hypothetical protein